MAKIIIIDDNGSTVEVTAKDLLTCDDSVHSYFSDKLFACSCGTVVLRATAISTSDATYCQACDSSRGSARYRILTRKYGRDAVHDFFMRRDAEAEADGSTGDITEAFYHYFLNGLNSDPAVISADIKHDLNALDDEDWEEIKSCLK